MIYVIDRDGWVLRYLDIVSLGISFIGLVVFRYFSVCLFLLIMWIVWFFWFDIRMFLLELLVRECGLKFFKMLLFLYVNL